MPAVVRIALGNVSRSVRDYSVYFATLAFATCLMYSFNASGDYLLAMPLNAGQLEVIHKAREVTGAFSVFVVLVFAVLVAYASRFIVRRRSREFATYGLLGMRAPSLAAILAAEGALVAPRRSRRGSRSGPPSRRLSAPSRRSSSACPGGSRGRSRPRPRSTRARGSPGSRGSRSRSPSWTCCVGRSWSSSGGTARPSGSPFPGIAG